MEKMTNIKMAQLFLSKIMNKKNAKILELFLTLTLKYVIL